MTSEFGPDLSWIWPLVVAPFIGSFISAIVARLDQPLSILWGRSQCVHCNHFLGPADLVPVFSWLALHGRCRHCAAPIDRLYPTLELIALCQAALAIAFCPAEMVWPTCILSWALLALAACDLSHYILPDFLTLPLIAAGLALQFYLDSPNIADYAIGAVAGLLLVVLVRLAYEMWRAREGVGLGDAKLLSAAGAWLSWQALPEVLLISTAVALLVVLCRSGAKASLTQRVPFGAYLSLAVWVLWLRGPLYP